MNIKLKLIKDIEQFSADLVWEIDSEKYYGFIGWDMSLDENSSWWLNYNLEQCSNKFLKEFINDLQVISKEASV